LYINIHSHSPAAASEWAIQNLYKDFNLAIKPGIYSAGLHPWYIDEAGWKAAFDTLKQYSRQQHVIAIGECGLDKVCNSSFPLQQEVFIAQLLWANEINKPLIIHCVKAFDEILGLLKKHSNKVPVIFHGFNKNRLLAEKIIQQGHWVSFGKALLQPAMQEIFASLPTDKIFLETDDATINIQQIYLAATSVKNISMEQLNLQLTKNVHAVFNITV
jgi:TatD DNase family protein